MSEAEIVDLEHEVGPQERQRKKRATGKFPEEKRKKRRKNPVSCALNKGELRGPFKGCEEDCSVYGACLEWAKEGYPGAILYSTAYRPVEGMKSMDCPYCGKPIARAGTTLPTCKYDGECEFKITTSLDPICGLIGECGDKVIEECRKTLLSLTQEEPE